MTTGCFGSAPPEAIVRPMTPRAPLSGTYASAGNRAKTVSFTHSGSVPTTATRTRSGTYTSRRYVAAHAITTTANARTRFDAPADDQSNAHTRTNHDLRARARPISASAHALERFDAFFFLSLIHI